ncbi:MAG: ATP-binding protein [Candidatus Acidiferrales bacterium]|jgi:PAS domain S-box-containing protein
MIAEYLIYLAPSFANAAPATGRQISPISLGIAAAFGLVILGIVILAGIAIRKLLHDSKDPTERDWSALNASAENPSAFMAASMQGVIEKLRTQERELARLHRLEQERARESERITEEVTRNMPTGLLLLSAKGAVTSANPAAETALGFTGMQYRSYFEVLGAESDLSKMLTACLSEGKTIHRAEVQYIKPNGDVRQLGVTISPIKRSVPNYLRPNSDAPIALATTDIKIVGALCLMSDLTELTDLQRQIRWKENLASLGEMSAGIAHEFKNALATISGYAQMIRHEALPGELLENSERILEQTRALTHVVTEFLRFARPLELSYEAVPVGALINRVAEEIQEAVPGSIIRADGDFMEIPCDEALLRQALLNLTRNAAEAVRERGSAGRVTISGSVQDRLGRPWQRIAVADNGPGIPDQDLSKIFLPFYTTKSEGTGLGLAVVQKVAMQHGGTVEARNHADGGAEFILWLPLRQDAVPQAFAPVASRV